uniref:Enoyl-[acyl-carrier-protein] reductase FabK n=1 Tax=Mesoaciditoga lauensis TaxID=1495039 RepID=A0A7V3REN1_9BACT
MFSRVCDILGIEYPIIQGGMAQVSTAKLAVAVSNAGGFGIIAAGGRDPEWVRAEIRKAKNMTEKPFGVNVIVYEKMADEIVKIILEEKVTAVTFGAGNPSKYIESLKEKGIKIIPVVASEAFAKRLESYGVDAVIAEGMESGGHIGEVTTMVLVPAVVDAVEIPVIAAGGIATGRQIAASFALGAEGVQIGTRFVATQECEVNLNYKEKILKASTRDTLVTGRVTGHPVRALRNPLTNELLKIDEKGGTVEEVEQLGRGALKAAVNGDWDHGSFMSGQSAGLIDDIPEVKELVCRLWKEALETIESFKTIDVEAKE